jgi:hypothetical protein
MIDDNEKLTPEQVISSALSRLLYAADDDATADYLVEQLGDECYKIVEMTPEEYDVHMESWEDVEEDIDVLGFEFT